MKNSFIVLLISLFLLSGCEGDRCIAPDDFGFIKYTISSRYTKEELNEQQQGMQVAPWRDSEYKVNGKPLTITVKPWSNLIDANTRDEVSAWCAWYGQPNNTANLSKFCSRLQDCTFKDKKMCTSGKDAQITNAPCLFRGGVGLYFLIAERDNSSNGYKDPNASFASSLSPEGLTKHLGETEHLGQPQHLGEPQIDFKFYDLDKAGNQVVVGGVNYQYQNKAEAVNYNQCPLYFKILDKFYDDNNGQYKVVIKSGVSDTRPDPLEFLTKLIRDELFGLDANNQGLVQRIYQKIIGTPGYRLMVTSLLTLYIMFTGISFLIGNINLTHTELITRAVKVTIISILINSTVSWEFFHNYLFVFFVEGTEQIVRVINESATTGSGASTIIGLMIAPQTMAKLFSLLLTDSLGFIYIILFLIALYFIFMMVFQATVIYLTALIAIGMILTMAPIFICFIMFDITRSLFENWLKQLISYALQPIILFTGLAFISMLIRTEIYNSLGFGVCKKDFPDLGPISQLFSSTDDLDPSISDSIFYWWFPSPLKGERFTKKKDNILVPIDHWIDDGTKEGKFCPAYQCVEERYVELPYLDPVKDADRINKFFNGQFVQFDALLLIFVCIYLLSKFNGMAVSIAKFISSSSGNLTNLQSIGHNAASSIQNFIEKPAIKYAADLKDRGEKQFNKYVRNRISGVIDGMLQERVKREALDPKSASKSVLDEVKKRYGVDYKDVNVNAQNDYENSIRERLKDLGVADADLDKKVQELSTMNFQKLSVEFAKLKFKDKEYSKLSTEQKEEISKLMKKKYNEKTLRELASDASFTMDFQKMYLEAHQGMSARGVGLFGKKFGILRNLQEINKQVDDKRKYKRNKEKAIGERLYAGYEGLKRNALTAIVGEDLRDAYEGNLTGAAWHDFDYRDAVLRTYSEKLKDDQINLEAEKLQAEINKEIVNNGEDILSPEFSVRLKQQGRDDDLQYYDQLSQQKLKKAVYDRFHDNDDPIIMGERFMREKATDSQLRTMIDKAHNAQAEIIEKDWYLRREVHYDIMHDNAAENIIEKYELLTQHYKIDSILASEVPDLLRRYYQETNTDPAVSEKEVETLKTSMRNFDYSKEVLEKIEERKATIRNEVASYVKEINEYRKSAKMAEYVKPIDPEEQDGRKVKSLETRLSSLKKPSKEQSND